MDIGDVKNLSENEKKILNLGKDENFRDQVIEMKDRDMSKEERISKIRKILSEKGIEYTEKDAELFESIIRGVKEKRIELNSENLKKITGGSLTEEVEDIFGGVPDDQIPANIKRKIADKKAAEQREKIIAYTVFGLLLWGAGGLGYIMGRRKSGEEVHKARAEGWKSGFDYASAYWHDKNKSS